MKRPTTTSFSDINEALLEEIDIPLKRSKFAVLHVAPLSEGCETDEDFYFEEIDPREEWMDSCSSNGGSEEEWDDFYDHQSRLDDDIYYADAMEDFFEHDLMICFPYSPMGYQNPCTKDGWDAPFHISGGCPDGRGGGVLFWAYSVEELNRAFDVYRGAGYLNVQIVGPWGK